MKYTYRPRTTVGEKTRSFESVAGKIAMRFIRKCLRQGAVLGPPTNGYQKRYVMKAFFQQS